MREVTSAWLKESCYWEVLPCGLSTYILPRRNWHQRSALLAIDFGAMDRCLRLSGSRRPQRLPAGTAHFLEHRLFYKTSGDITERFGRHGAEVDADTAYTHTGFSVSCRAGFEAALELLLELAFLSSFDPSGVEHEREIIAREIQLSADALDWVGYLRALDTIFPGQPIAEDLAGSMQSLQCIDAELLSLCHDSLYRAARASLFICGDVNPVRVRRLVSHWLDAHPKAAAPPEGHLDRKPLPQSSPRRTASFLPISRPHLTLAFRDPRGFLSGLPLLQREMALELAVYTVFGPSSRWYNQRYEEGMIDSDSFGTEINAEPAFGVCLFSGETARPGELEAAIVTELEKAMVDGLNADDFALARQKAYGDLVRAYDSAENAVELMHSAVSCGAQPFDFLTAYQHLTLSDANECLQTILRPDRRGCSLIRPISDV